MARNYRQGPFYPKYPKKYVGDASKIVYRSSWELKFMNWCDANPSVLMWCSEEVIISYYSRADGKMRRYFTDFMIKYEGPDGKPRAMLIEVKPKKQTEMPKAKRVKKAATLMEETYTYMVNQDKWEAAEKWAASKGMEFRVLTEDDLGIKR